MISASPHEYTTLLPDSSCTGKGAPVCRGFQQDSQIAEGLQERQECCGWNEIGQFKAIKSIFLKPAFRKSHGWKSSGVSGILRITLSPRRTISQQSLATRGDLQVLQVTPWSTQSPQRNRETLLSAPQHSPHGSWGSGTQQGFPSGRKIKKFGAALLSVCDNL